MQAPVLAHAAATAGQRMADDVLSDPRYQTSLPDAEPSRAMPLGDPKPASGQQSQQKSAGDSGDASTQNTTPPDTTPQDASPEETPPASPAAQAPSAVTTALLQVVLAIVLAAVVIAVLVFVIRSYRQRRRATVPEEVIPLAITPGPTGAPVPSAAILSEWQRLADQGRFTEAIHVLFLHLLAQLRRDRILVPATSQTSREILQMDNLPGDRRPGLATIIGAVEFCHFGGRPAGAQLFQHCLAAYDQVVTTAPRDIHAK